MPEEYVMNSLSLSLSLYLFSLIPLLSNSPISFAYILLDLDHRPLLSPLAMDGWKVEASDNFLTI